MLNNSLKKIRKEKNIKITDLAKEIGVTTSLLYAFESGKCLPSDNVLQKISKYLNVRIDEILRPSYSQDKELMMRAMQIVVNSLEGCAYSIDFKSEVGLKVFSNLVNLRKEPLNDHDVNELIEDLEIQKVANKCLINYLKKEYLPTTKLL